METATLQFSADSCTINCPPQLILTDLSLALEFLAENFIGRGVYRWSLDRLKGDDGQCLILAKAMSPSGPTKISTVMTLGVAVREGFLPRNLKDNELFPRFNQTPTLAKDGQNRKFDENDGWQESVIEAHQCDPHGQLSVMSYGFADMCVGLFNLGIRHIKYQISLNTSQIYVKHKIEEYKIVNFFRQKGMDYPIEAKVISLP